MSSGFGGSGQGQIRYVISVDDSQAIQQLQGLETKFTEMGNATQGATKATQEMTTAQEENNRTANESVRSQQSLGSAISQTAIGISLAVSSVISLVHQYTSLQRAQVTLQSAQDREKSQKTQLVTLQDAYNKKVDKYGKHSHEAEVALQKLHNAQDKHKTQLEKIDLMQTSLNERMTDFAVNIIPSVIGVVAGLAQTIQILHQGVGGGGGIKGLTLGLGRIFIPLAALGVALFAVKHNIFGARDAVNSFGKQIGDAVPFLKPFLNAIKDVGTVLGILPGDAGKAQQRLKSFAGGVIEWAKQVGAEFMKIIDLIKKGDIKGAIDKVKQDLKTAFNVTIGSITFDGKPISKWIDQLVTFWQVDMKRSGPWQATIDTANVIFKTFVWPNFTEEAKKGLIQFQSDIKSVFENPAGAGLGNIVISLDKLWTSVSIASGDQNTPFDNWLKTNIGRIKAVWKKGVSQVNNFLRSTPIIGDIVNVLFPSGDITGGADISGFIYGALDRYVLTPIYGAWNDTVTSTQGYFKDNPIFQKLQAGDIIGAIDIAVTDINGLFDRYILTPLTGSWNGTQQAWQKYVVDPVNTLMNSINATKIMGTISDLTGPIRTWFGTYIGKPITDAWNNFKSTVVKFFTDNPIFNAVGGALESFKNFIFGDHSHEAHGEGVDIKSTIATVDNTKALSAVDVVAKRIADLEKIVPQISLQNKVAIKVTDVVANRIDSLEKLKPQISLQNNKAIKILDVVANRIDSLEKLKPQISLQNNKAIKAVDVVAKRIDNLSNITPTIHVNNNKALSAVDAIARRINSLPSAGLAKGGIISAAGGYYTTNGPQMLVVGDNPGGRETIAAIPRNNPNPTLDRLNRSFGRSGYGSDGVIYQTTILNIEGNDIINTRALKKTIQMTIGNNFDKYGSS